MVEKFFKIVVLNGIELLDSIENNNYTVRI